MKLRTLNIFYIGAICFAIISLVFHFLTYFPDLRTSKSSLIFLLGVAIFPFFIIGIKSTQNFVDKNNPMRMWKDLMQGTPRFLKVLVVLTISYVFFNFFFSLMYLTEGLSPDIIDNVYVLSNKGKIVREISETEYFKYIAYEFRGMSGHFILFQLISVALISSAINVLKNKSQE